MAATLRRALRVMLLVSTLIAMTSALGIAGASAATRVGSASQTPGVPTSQIKSVGTTTATYCVTNYAPNSAVAVVNKANGAVSAITTDSTGAGCTTIAITQACAANNETIVASGVDAEGKAATSQAIANVPADTALCSSASPTPTPTTTSTSTCASSGAADVTVSIAGFVITLRGSACGFLPGETVDGYAHSTPKYLGSTIARADGTAVIKAVVPTCLAAGTHTLELVGETSGNVASAPFSVSLAHSCAAEAAAGGGTTGTGSGGGGGGISGSGAQSGSATTGANSGSLAFTGADILAMVLAAIVLLVIGTIVVLTVRRRRTVSAA